MRVILLKLHHLAIALLCSFNSYRYQLFMRLR